MELWRTPGRTVTSCLAVTVPKVAVSGPLFPRAPYVIQRACVRTSVTPTVDSSQLSESSKILDAQAPSMASHSVSGIQENRKPLTLSLFAQDQGNYSLHKHVLRKGNRGCVPGAWPSLQAIEGA